MCGWRICAIIMSRALRRFAGRLAFAQLHADGVGFDGQGLQFLDVADGIHRCDVFLVCRRERCRQRVFSIGRRIGATWYS